MKIELNAEISAVITKYAELTGHTPDEFLNRKRRFWIDTTATTL
jgi:hypothetical protein